jgi:hypothetical protein
MGLTKRKDSYYVEFQILDDGKVLSLAPPGTGKLKRWKVCSRNRRTAEDMEGIIRTRLLTGQEVSRRAAKAKAITFREWAGIYLNLESVKRLNTYEDRKLKVQNLVEFFGDKLLVALTPDDVAQYRATRVQYRRITCVQCQALVTRAACGKCGWVRTEAGKQPSVQTINHDHTALTHMLNVAKGH